MRVYVNQKQMARVAANAANVTPKKTPRPIMTHILLRTLKDEASGDRLEVVANDEEMTYKTTVEAQIELEGELCVDARDFSAVIASMPVGQTIVLEEVGHALEEPAGFDLNIYTPNGRKIDISLPTLPSLDFPDAIPTHESTQMTLPAGELLRLFEQVSFCCSSDEARYYLGGVYTCVQDDKPIRVVATDGHRLAVADGESAANAQDVSKNAIIPRRVLTEIRRAFDAKGSPISLGLSEKHVYFAQGAQSFASLLVDGSFPDYKQVLPKKSIYSFLGGKKAIVEALRRVALINSDTMAVTLTIGSNALTIEAASPKKGSAKETIKVDAVGELLDDTHLFGVNAKYILDALGALPAKCESVKFEFVSMIDPCVITPNNEDAKAMYVVMPMRV